jgi:hypothetical protein
MQAEPILLELEAVKERLAAEASGDTRRFLDQMEAWLVEHPHSGPVVNSPEELQARLRAREATEPPPPQGKPYRVYDPIIAEVHRTREKLYRERKTAPLILKDEPPCKKR